LEERELFIPGFLFCIFVAIFKLKSYWSPL